MNLADKTELAIEPQIHPIHLRRRKFPTSHHIVQYLYTLLIYQTGPGEDKSQLSSHSTLRERALLN